MSDSMRNILIAFLIPVIVFLISAFVLDKDMVRYPFVSSAKGMEREKSAVIEAVRMYNKILTDFYSSGGKPALLNEFPATKAIKHGVFRDLGFITTMKRVLVYDMADMMPVDVRITSFNTAQAVVFEEWNYVYQRIEDRMPVSALKGLGQGFRYWLARQGGTWIVTGWTPVEVEEPEDKGFLF